MASNNVLSLQTDHVIFISPVIYVIMLPVANGDVLVGVSQILPYLISAMMMFLLLVQKRDLCVLILIIVNLVNIMRGVSGTIPSVVIILLMVCRMDPLL